MDTKDEGLLTEAFAQIRELRRGDIENEKQIREQFVKLVEGNQRSLKDQRDELTATFNSAHAQNLRSLDKLSVDMKEMQGLFNNRLDLHEAEDNDRFHDAYRYIWIGVGGVSVLAFLAGIGVTLYIAR